ncbi:hypothetical protein UY3_05525 [Chelonia mydas]|uniref:Uncharacterized protein n=1 Tax=Chelonia mydas TaxID=8469 RepID=M7BYY0_CHEMY|nr:hypothetical protein UY3_05525 [Chelonia mydas]
MIPNTGRPKTYLSLIPCVTDSDPQLVGCDGQKLSNNCSVTYIEGPVLAQQMPTPQMLLLQMVQFKVLMYKAVSMLLESTRSLCTISAASGGHEEESCCATFVKTDLHEQQYLCQTERLQQAIRANDNCTERP